MKNFLIYILLFSLLSPQVIFAQSPFGGPPQNPTDPGSATNPGPSGLLGDPTNPTSATNPGAPAGLENPTNPGAVTDPGTGIDAGVGVDAGTGIDAGTGLEAGPATEVTGNGLIPTANDPGFVLGSGRPTDPGYVLYAGGGDRFNFWDYLKGLFSLDGQDNQLTDKNNENIVIESTYNLDPYTVGTTPKNLVKSDTSSRQFCTRNTSTSTVNGYINLATCVVLVLIPIVVSGLVLWFMFGSIRVLGDNESEKRNEYKQFLAWGLLIIFVALSFVGILRVLSKTLGV